MHPDIKVWLKDIQLSINEIYEFLPLRRNYILFQKDLKTRKAVERNIEIIGEAGLQKRFQKRKNICWLIRS